MLGLTVAALAVRLLAGQFVLGGLGRDWHGDEGSYVRPALTLAEGRGFLDQHGKPNCNRTPGLPFLLSLVYRVTGERIVGTRVLMCVLGSLIVPACFLLGRSVAGVRAGLWSAAAAAVFPHWVYYSDRVLTDVPGAVLAALTAWLVIQGWRRQRLFWFLLSGILLGAGTLVRPTHLVFVPAAAFWALLVMPDWRRRLVAAVLVVIPFISVVVPWSIRNSLAFGQFVGLSGQSGITLWIGNNPAATGILGPDFRYYLDQRWERFPPEDYPNAVARADAFKAEAVAWIKQHPARFLELCAIRFRELWKIYSPRIGLMQNLVSVASFGVVLPLFLVQLARRGWRRGPELLLVLMIAGQTAIHTAFTAVVRYRIPIEPLVVVMAAAALVWAVDRFRPGDAQPAASGGESATGSPIEDG